MDRVRPGRERREDPPKGAHEGAENGSPVNGEADVVSQIMTTDVRTLSPEVALQHAWEVVRNEGAKHVVLLSPSNEVVGVLSDLDIYRTVAIHLLDKASQPATPILQQPVGSVVTRKPSCITPGARVCDATALLQRTSAGVVAVVDDAQGLVGLLTRRDVLEALATDGQEEAQA
jgi:CBS domain-containing protein